MALKHEVKAWVDTVLATEAKNATQTLDRLRWRAMESGEYATPADLPEAPELLLMAVMKGTTGAQAMDMALLFAEHESAVARYNSALALGEQLGFVRADTRY